MAFMVLAKASGAGALLKKLAIRDECTDKFSLVPLCFIWIIKAEAA
jgi:hypothetical protein